MTDVISNDDQPNSRGANPDDNPSHSPMTCAACRIIDAADGSVDGVLFAPPTVHAIHEHKLLGPLLRAQDKAADKITNFAGLPYSNRNPVWNITDNMTKLSGNHT